MPGRCEACGRRTLVWVLSLRWGRAQVIACRMCEGQYRSEGKLA